MPSAAEVSLGQEAPPALVPWAMHEMRSPHDRPANHDHFPDDRPVMHDPAFHNRLDHPVDDGPFHDRLHDFSLDDASLDDGTNDVALDNTTFDTRRFVLIINLDAAPRATAEPIVVFERIASAELRGGRSGCDYGRGRIGECGHTTYGECLDKRT
jgi:hypothetical protein